MTSIGRDKITQVWRLEPIYDPSHLVIQEAARLVRDGNLVAFPTETVYGLGADARSTEAVERIFEAKGRPSDNPLIVHISDKSQLYALVERVDEISLRLIEAFWPGPLTLVLPVKDGAVSAKVTAGLATVAVRMPDHPTALSLIVAAGCPLAAPSANRSGRPSPTTAAHVLDDLAGRIEGILDAGPTGVGLESTVVEVAAGHIHVLRPGGISVEQLRAAIPGCAVVDADSAGEADSAGDAGNACGADGVAVAAGATPAAATPAAATPAAATPAAGTAPAASAAPPWGEAERDIGANSADIAFRPKAPGMKYTHYAPLGQLTVVRGSDPARVAERIWQELEAARSRGERTGVLTCREHANLYRRCDETLVVPCGSLIQPASIARELYAAIRSFDDAGITFILAEAFAETGMGHAIMNRLMKAAGQRVIDI